MDDEAIVLDIETVTLGELEAIEEIAGVDAVRSLLTGGAMTMKVMIAVAYVVKRRDDPEFTIEDAKALKVMGLKQPDPVGKAEGNGISK